METDPLSVNTPMAHDGTSADAPKAYDVSNASTSENMDTNAASASVEPKCQDVTEMRPPHMPASFSKDGADVCSTGVVGNTVSKMDASEEAMETEAASLQVDSGNTSSVDSLTFVKVDHPDFIAPTTDEDPIFPQPAVAPPVVPTRTATAQSPPPRPPPPTPAPRGQFAHKTHQHPLQETEATSHQTRHTQAPVAAGSPPAGATHPGFQTKKSKREYSVLIIGKTGNGKSSLANTITGAKNFPVGRGLSSTTTDAQSFTAEVQGRYLKVIDTPDFTNLMADKRTAQQHVDRWKVLTNSLPDVIILTVRCDVRYTKEEHDIYQAIQDRWGDRSVFQKRLMVAFTFGDRQDEDLEEELEMVCEELKSVLKDAKNRFVQVNNRARGEGKMEQLDNICRQLNRVINQEGAEPDVPVQENKEFAVVIIGKTGHGKSSVGNLLCGQRQFPEGWGPSFITTCASHYTIEASGKTFKVIDTQDIRDLMDAKKQHEIRKWKELASAMPVFILLAVRCDVRYTSDEGKAYEDIKRLWGHDSPFNDNRVIIAFTFKDAVDVHFHSLIRKCEWLATPLRDADNRYVLVNSKEPDQDTRHAVDFLLKMIIEKGMSHKRTDQPEAHEGGLLTRIQETAKPIISKVGDTVSRHIPFRRNNSRHGDDNSRGTVV
ncbi:GTPase IMAP family member 8-like isoform X2 [Babylonia areolata]|uniref:GTPase IMAP family member 8-like isoform X2 n=1 Tax=Babylonia areolata TaxID=304850 RepID=UPI003FD1AC94